MSKQEMLSTGQAAAMLGVSRGTVWRWIIQGQIVASKPGNHYRIEKHVIAALCGAVSDVEA